MEHKGLSTVVGVFRLNHYYPKDFRRLRFWRFVDICLRAVTTLEIKGVQVGSAEMAKQKVVVLSARFDQEFNKKIDRDQRRRLLKSKCIHP